MIAAKPIAAISLAFALAASPSALASPAGSEYLPKEPKASHDSSNDGGPSASGYSDTSTDDTYTQSSAGSSEGHKPNHAQKKHDQGNTAPPVMRTTATGDTGGSNALLPLILLIAAGGIVVVAGLLLRRRHTRHLAYQAPKR